MKKRVISLVLAMVMLLPLFALMEKGPAELVYDKDGVKITLTKGREYNSDYVVADIIVDDVKKIQRAFAKGGFGEGGEMLSDLAGGLGAVIALSGDYASNNFKNGHVVQNGEVIRKTENKSKEICYIYEDGTMETLKDTKANFEKASKKGIWQSFTFGPGLIFNGEPIKKNNSKVGAANPRAAIGYYEPGHYCFVIVDGRSDNNRGMKMQQLVSFMASLGCKEAYNLDGGQSASMYFDGEILNNPYKGGRPVGDCIYIVGETGESVNKVVIKK